MLHSHPNKSLLYYVLVPIIHNTHTTERQKKIHTLQAPQRNTLQAFVCICTIKSELTRVLDLVQMGEPGSISAGFSVGGSTPNFNQEDFSAVYLNLCDMTDMTHRDSLICIYIAGGRRRGGGGRGGGG